MYAVDNGEKGSKTLQMSLHLTVPIGPHFLSVNGLVRVFIKDLKILLDYSLFLFLIQRRVK